MYASCGVNEFTLVASEVGGKGVRLKGRVDRMLLLLCHLLAVSGPENYKDVVTAHFQTLIKNLSSLLKGHGK